MNKALSELLEESINVELNTGKLYRLYSDMFPEDRDFWMRVSMEEMNHASLLKSARQFLKLGKLPAKSLYPNIETLKGMNLLITSRIEEFSSNRPGMLEAYTFAQELESSAAEEHFQEVMSGTENDRVLEIFRNLAGADLDHAGRIKALMDMRIDA